jgi:hypothetical protein
MTEQPGKDLARVGTYGRSSLTEKQQYAVALSRAGELVPKNFWTKPENVDGVMVPPRPNPGAILYMLETAAMVGVNPMVGLTNIHIIEGKPSLSANLQAALVREAGHRLRVWTEGTGPNLKAICEIVRSDDPDFTFRVEWGAAESRAAGVDNKDNWKKYRRSMLKARSITECVREACPEVLMGATYSPDELGANTDEMGEPINLEQVPDKHPNVSRETSTPAAAAPIVDTPPQQTDEDVAADPETGEVKAFDWKKAVDNLETSDDARSLWQAAKNQGVLDMEIRRGRQPKRVLGPWIVEIGERLAKAEEEKDAAEAEAMVFAEAAAEQAHEDDPNVVDAEVVEDGDGTEH